MKRRAAATEETRERIVRATAELHAEKGIADTSFRDIAERADVAIGSVYHHFPTYDDVIQACGRHTTREWPHPDETIFEGLDDPAIRLDRLTAEIFRFYEEFPGLDRIVADRHRFPMLEGFLREQEKLRRTLIRSAVAPERVDRRAVDAATALLSFEIYQAFRRSGMSRKRAEEEAGALLRHRLLNE